MATWAESQALFSPGTSKSVLPTSKAPPSPKKGALPVRGAELLVCHLLDNEIKNSIFWD